MHAFAAQDSRRLSQRKNLITAREVYLIAPGTDRAIKASIIDISSEGIGIESHQEIMPGTEYRLFSLTLSVSTVVVWTKKNSRWGKTVFRAGLRLRKSGLDLTHIYAHLING